jgi:hypothetical protein
MFVHREAAAAWVAIGFFGLLSSGVDQLDDRMAKTCVASKISGFAGKARRRSPRSTHSGVVSLRAKVARSSRAGRASDVDRRVSV